LLQRSLWPDPSAGRGAFDRLDRGDLSPRQTRGRSPAQSSTRPLYDPGRTPAQGPSTTPAMDSQPDRAMGGADRALLRAGGRRDPGQPSASRTRFSLLFGDHSPGQGRRPVTAGGGLSPLRPVEALRQLGRYRLSAPARTEAGTDRTIARLPMGAAASQLPDQRSDGLRKNLSGLRLGPPSLPRRSPNPLLLRAQAISGAANWPGRWQSAQPAQEAGPSGVGHHRRFWHRRGGRQTIS